MYIRKTSHTHNKTGKKYDTHKLVETIRTDRGPRQHTVLNLGADFSVPKERWKELANRIEGIVSGQLSLFPVAQDIEPIAQRYANRIIATRSQRAPQRDREQPDYQTVDINSLENDKVRSVGGESVVLSTIQKLELDKKLVDLGFNQPNVEAAIGVITARLLAPCSEHATHHWLQKHTSIDELMDTSFDSLSQDRVYKVSDMLLKHKSEIEAHLQNKESHLFNLEEKVLLYDLTNTFFEGSGKYNAKAHFGLSKEKRSDCPLVTLGLLLDADGFPKKSEVFEGNVSEAATLEKILSQFHHEQKPTIVADAGIGTDQNVQWMKDNGYTFIVVSRKRKMALPADTQMVTVREDDRRLIRACLRTNGSDETELYCHSTAKEIKESGIKTRFEIRFEDAMAEAKKALSKKNGTKKYEKVLEKIGRLKERYRRVSRRYEISVEKSDETGNATDILWHMKPMDDTTGYYVLRSNISNKNEKELFDIFTTLVDLEDAFRSMKSVLGFRPIYHQKEHRCDGHLFISVLAYHVLHSIRLQLRNQGIISNWSTVRNILSTHFRVTTSMKRSDGKMLFVRKTAKPEDCHIKIYDALGLPHRPGKIQKSIL